jgi:hypothetical protein
VAQDVQPVGAGDLDRLDLVVRGEGVGEVTQLAPDPGGDHRALPLEQLGRRRARRDQPLFRFGGIALDDHTEV